MESSSSSPKPASSYPPRSQSPQPSRRSQSPQPPSQRPPPSSSSSSSTKWLPHEERLRKAWRVIGTTVANCMSKADKATTKADNAATQSQFKRELEESVILFLRTRREFHRLLSHAEAKLQGKAEEMESLETYVRTQPRVGKRKRKR